ncbi:MAG: DUF169 domain-containing protein [Campylobacteraceae bacterium]
MTNLYNQLNTYLDLKRSPAGIRFLFDKQEYDECETPASRHTLPYCTAIRNAMQGEASKVTLEHMSCLSSARVLGLLKPEDDVVPFNFVISGKRFAKMGIYKDFTIARQIQKDMTYCTHKVYGIEIAPLQNFTTYEPDVVIIATHAYNMMRIVQGYAYNFGQLKNIKMSGMQALCAECTTYVFENNQVNISMLCSGTRQFATWTNEDLAIGIPFNKLESIVEGIVKTSNPMQTNKAKKAIEERANKYDLAPNIAFNTTYYKGTLGTVNFIKNRKS